MSVGDEVGRAAGMLVAAGRCDIELTVDHEAGVVAIDAQGYWYSTIVPLDELVGVIEHWLHTRSSGVSYSTPGRRLDGAPCI